MMRLSLIIAAIGIPLAAGGMYAYKVSRCGCDRKVTSAPTPGCCDSPTRADLFLTMATQAAEERATKNTDCPMFGGTPQRNMVNTIDKNIPISWEAEEGKEKNIKWSAALGNKVYGGPIVAEGKVFVGTNNAVPRDPKIDGHKANLMAFDEATGKFLWQIIHEIPPDALFNEARNMGLCSTPISEAGKLYYVTPGCELVCATHEGKVTWKYDMMKQLKVIPFHLGNCSPVIVGDLVLLLTSNGLDEQNEVVASPKAPSFVAVNKKTGDLVWQSALPGDEIIEGQWSNPAVAIVAGKPQVIFPGGDGVLYSLEPETGKLIWKFDCHPGVGKDEKGRRQFRNYFIATPVIDGSRLYIAMGVYPGGHPHPTKFAHVFCLDVTKSGDVSPKTLDAKDPANKDSALVWAFGGEIKPRPDKGRQVYFRSTISTCAVHEGLVYISEEGGYINCLDAKTGDRVWLDDLKSDIWGSPYCVDGKVLIGTEDGSVFLFKQGREKKLLATIEMNETIHSTPVVANGVLYIATKSKLYAIAEKK